MRGAMPTASWQRWLCNPPTTFKQHEAARRMAMVSSSVDEQIHSAQHEPLVLRSVSKQVQRNQSNHRLRRGIATQQRPTHFILLPLAATLRSKWRCHTFFPSALGAASGGPFPDLPGSDGNVQHCCPAVTVSHVHGFDNKLLLVPRAPCSVRGVVPDHPGQSSAISPPPAVLPASLQQQCSHQQPSLSLYLHQLNPPPRLPSGALCLPGLPRVGLRSCCPPRATRLWRRQVHMKAGGIGGRGEFICGNPFYQGAFGSAVSTLEELQQHLVAGDEKHARLQASQCASQFGVAECPAGVRAVLEHIERAGLQPSEFELSCLLESHVFSGDVDAGLGVLAEMRDLQVPTSKQTWSVLLRGLLAHSVDHETFSQHLLPRILGAMAPQPTDLTYLALLEGAQVVQSMPYVVAIAHHANVAMGGIPLSIWNVLLQVYGRLRDEKRLTSLFYHILECGLTPDVDTYASLISSYGQLGDVRKAEALFQRVHSLGAALPETIYAGLLNAYALSKSDDRAMQLLRHMQAVNVPMTAAVRVKLAKVYAFCGNVSAVEALVSDAAVVEGPSAVPEDLFRMLMHAYAMHQDVSRAVEVFHDMMDASISPTASTCHVLISAHLAANQPSEAQAAFRYMIDLGIRPYAATFNSLFNHFGRRNEMDRLHALLDDMPLARVPPNVVTCNTLIKAMCMARETDRAEQLVDYMLAHHLQPDQLTWGPLFGLYARMGNYRQLEHMVQRAIDSDCIPTEFTMESVGYLLRRKESMAARRVWATISRMVLNAEQTSALKREQGGNNSVSRAQEQQPLHAPSRQQAKQRPRDTSFFTVTHQQPRGESREGRRLRRPTSFSELKSGILHRRDQEQQRAQQHAMQEPDSPEMCNAANSGDGQKSDKERGLYWFQYMKPLQGREV